MFCQKDDTATFKAEYDEISYPHITPGAIEARI